MEYRLRVSWAPSSVGSGWYSADSALQTRRVQLEETETALEGLAHLATLADPEMASRPMAMTPEEYVTTRVQSQILWYQDKTRFNARRATAERAVEGVGTPAMNGSTRAERR